MVPVFKLKKGRIVIEKDTESVVNVIAPKVGSIALNDWFKLIVDGEIKCRILTFAAAYKEAKSFAANLQEK